MSTSQLNPIINYHFISKNDWVFINIFLYINKNIRLFY
jgi:hypothetical protein